MYDKIRPGRKWLDTEGKSIQAHGFSVFYDQKDGLYYWYGENKEKTKGGLFNTIWHWGVRCYSSRDLCNWKDCGLIIPPEPDDLQSPLHPTYCMDRPHFEIVTATLSDHYTEVTGEFSSHYTDLHPPISREAPVYFERGGRKYLITSGTSGYYPNPSRVCVFDDFHGEYTDLGDPCAGDIDGTSFHAQFTCVLEIPGTGQYVAMADRWKPRAIQKKIGHSYLKLVERAMSGSRHADITVPDRSPRPQGSVSGKLTRHMENTSIARYVWLPIEWEGEKPRIRWKDEWKPDL